MTPREIYKVAFRLHRKIGNYGFLLAQQPEHSLRARLIQDAMDGVRLELRTLQQKTGKYSIGTAALKSTFYRGHDGYSHRNCLGSYQFDSRNDTDGTRYLGENEQGEERWLYWDNGKLVQSPPGTEPSPFSYRPAS